MRLVTLSIRLTLQGPVLTASSAPGAPGVDTAAAKTTREDGEHWMLPFSLVRGRVRESLEQLGSTDPTLLSAIDTWFGPRQGSGDPAGGAWEPQRGHLVFSDFIGPRASAAATMTSIRTDAERQAVDTGAMHVFDKPFAPGAEVEFTGEVSFFAEDEHELATVQGLVTQGLAWTTMFGAQEGVGFGVNRGVAVTATCTEIVPPQSQRSEQELWFSLQFTDPFCIAKRRVSDNVFESADVIPGGVLKGTLATMLKSLLGEEALSSGGRSLPESADAWRPLCRHFDALSFSHARPVKPAEAGAAPSMPTQPPLSLVLSRDGKTRRDAALYDGAFLLKTSVGEAGNASEEMAAPRFAVDWKSAEVDSTEADFSIVHPQREVRVHTAIDPEARRALDEKLFAYEMVVPFGFLWVWRADLRGVDDSERAAVAGALGGLLEQIGLHGLGKSKARAKVHPHVRPGDRGTGPGPIDGKLWVLTLQTPALLCDPAELDEKSGDVQLRNAYEAAWSGLSAGPDKMPTLRLVRFFASQTLAGGYLTHRFQKGKPYNPFLLTDAGSVFVLEQTGEGDAAAFIREWTTRGLPLPPTVCARFGGTWQENPFLREHGYGEVVVNQRCHLDLRPTPGECPAVELLPPTKEVVHA